MLVAVCVATLSGSAVARAAVVTDWVRTMTASPFITDTLGGNGTPDSSPWESSNATRTIVTDTSTPVSGLITDTLAGRGTPHSSPFDTAAPKLITNTATGFSWSDAGIGAAIASGALALLAACSIVLRRHTRPAF